MPFGLVIDFNHFVGGDSAVHRRVKLHKHAADIFTVRQVDVKRNRGGGAVEPGKCGFVMPSEEDVNVLLSSVILQVGDLT